MAELEIHHEVEHADELGKKWPATIIIDNRGYEAHQDLIPVNNRLLKFVEDGGTLLGFYHRTNEWNPNEQRARPQLAPYPIIIDDSRVTEEEAPAEVAEVTEEGAALEDEGAESLVPGREDTSEILAEHHPETADADAILEGNIEETKEEEIGERKDEGGA